MNKGGSDRPVEDSQMRTTEPYGEMAESLRGLRRRLERLDYLATAGLGLSLGVLAWAVIAG
ncbi:hypothetical protein [Oleisolibacter albus]|uniref:hypothetical protein n=1 Tax=Oleisolibacter albus TaxID=2171757 RepID=UPI000DF33787|nr:hypothetical protein [Oleisolibacter albus]